MVTRKDIKEGAIIQYDGGAIETILLIETEGDGSTKLLTRFEGESGTIVQTLEVFLSYCEDFGGTVVA